MKTFSYLAALMLLTSGAAHASTFVYNCTLKGSNSTAELVYYPTTKRADWIPDDQVNDIKTTKANTEGSEAETNMLEFVLFGFQDQADYLMVPAAIEQGPKTLSIYTYHDDDDQAVDRQDFTCTR